MTKRYEVTIDGRKFEVTAPDDATASQIETYARQQAAQIRSAQTQVPPNRLGPEYQLMQRLGHNFMADIRDLPQNVARAARPLGLMARDAGVVAGGLAGIVVDPITQGINATTNFATGGNFWTGEGGRGTRIPTYAQGMQNAADVVGLPRPESTPEKVASFANQVIMGIPLGNVASARALEGLGMTLPQNVQQARTAAQAYQAATPGRSRLLNEGVPLTRGQRTDSVLWNRVGAGATDNPATAQRAVDFSESQLRGFTRAILRRIGLDSDEATRPAMLSAKQAIGSVFDDIASKNPVTWDQTLSDDIGGIMRDARVSLKDDEFALLQRTYKNIRDAVVTRGSGLAGENRQFGQIVGARFNSIRSDLSNLSRRPDVGHFASDIEDALMDGLARSSPQDASRLRQAISQWRSMRVIEGAIGRGEDKFISPLRLANALSTKTNRAMSVYGQGGDQSLLELAEAARSVLPESLPQSGTTPRSLMQAPLRVAATAPIYRALQSAATRQPSPFPSPAGALNFLYPMGLPSAAIASRNALVDDEERRNALYGR